MCGRYTITITLEELMTRYGVIDTNVPWHRPRYNVAPGQLVPAIIHDGEKNRLGQLKWGLVPPWAPDAKIGFKMINARAETAAGKPAFREAFRRKRCIIPADGFYEWKKTKHGKQPMRIIAKERPLFSMAGLYETWRAPDGSKLATCTILTTEPNHLVAPIHDRMPVILQAQDEALWLDRGTGLEQLSLLMKPYPAEEMTAYPVGQAVGSVRHDDATLIEPRHEDEQMELW
ncbi:SOS response-associated peptidase [Paenibacillus chungangensis]|uniref:Abasic site processing protein n=1 Tax=Paenibacillus chungangensis TaxID=696535 RepID=A0ABW3HPG4_9BACL